MTRVYYMVGANGYYTRCNSYKGALEQQMIGAMNGVQYEIKTCYEPIETEYTRIVGFYTPISTWSSERNNEYQMRKWEPINQKEI